MSDKVELLESIIADLKKSKKHLEYSYNKVQKITIEKVGDDDDETLETLESFSSRFARFSDIVINRYLRLKSKNFDPAFQGSLIDLLNLSEKQSWIEDAKIWYRIRELRNVAAHEYSIQDFRHFYLEIRKLCPHLLALPISSNAT